MSSLRFEPAPRHAPFSCTPLGAGRADDWVGRWADGRSPSVVVNIGGLNAPSREYDIVVREQLSASPGALLRNTFVQIYESHSLASLFPHTADGQPTYDGTPPDEPLRTLLLPEYGIILGLYLLIEHHPAEWPGRHSRIIRYRRPATPRAPAADLMLRQTPRVS